MLQVRVHVPRADAGRAVDTLAGQRGVSRIVAADHADGTMTLLTAEVDVDDADAVLVAMERIGVAAENIALVRLAEIAPVSAHARGHDEGIIWADLVNEARLTAQPAARYLALMGVAGIVAAFGVMDSNIVLIVGAMAVSPDLLPIIGACIGIAAGRRRMVARALVTLAIGLATAMLVAAALTVGLLGIGWLPAGFTPDPTDLGTLVTVDLSSVIIATAAGVAGMLAFETRASAAVGVAISVTTIPAAAFFGVALGASHFESATGALAVLSVNVASLLLGGTATIWLQGRIAGRRAPQPRGGGE
jgi:uncharacterized hydrophobic protein (TIGR00271 family)